MTGLDVAYMVAVLALAVGLTLVIRAHLLLLDRYETHIRRHRSV